MSVTQETLESSDLINWTIFQELLLMDEDEEGFALSLVETFVQQANDTFKEIEALLSPESEKNEENLIKLSSLGHYLKGSAAALGLQKVQNQCERIQNYGKMEIFDNEQLEANNRTIQDWFDCCSEAYVQVQEYFNQSKDLLSQYFQSPL